MDGVNEFGSPRELDELMRAFYEVISFPEGGAPDWPRMARLFSPHALITRVTPEATDYMDLAGFRAMAEEAIELGVFTSFYEREVARRSDAYGRVLHVASAYETLSSPSARDALERGVNSLQLVREGSGWQIVSLCWDTSGPFEPNGLQEV